MLTIATKSFILPLSWYMVNLDLVRCRPPHRHHTGVDATVHEWAVEQRIIRPSRIAQILWIPAAPTPAPQHLSRPPRELCIRLHQLGSTGKQPLYHLLIRLKPLTPELFLAPHVQERPVVEPKHLPPVIRRPCLQPRSAAPQ